ncbi:MAG: HAD-IA family hydrolase [Ruminococcus sp.]|nr:HAD-IA family hydrolase [Ruminococcus sp.]
MMSIAAVVFDMDGVIFDTETVGLESWEIVGTRHGLENVRKYALECIGRSTKDSMEILRSAYPDQDIDRLRDECTGVFADIIEREGLKFKAGVRELLEWLKSNGIKTALASSTSYKGVCAHLERAGIKDYFDKIIGGDMVENSKPEPEIYLKACKLLDAAPENAYAIEDSNNGIISAYRAGMKPLLVPDIVKNTDEVRTMAQMEFDDLFGVLGYFEKILTQ